MAGTSSSTLALGDCRGVSLRTRVSDYMGASGVCVCKFRRPALIPEIPADSPLCPSHCLEDSTFPQRSCDITDIKHIQV